MEGTGTGSLGVTVPQRLITNFGVLLSFWASDCFGFALLNLNSSVYICVCYLTLLSKATSWGTFYTSWGDWSVFLVSVGWWQVTLPSWQKRGDDSPTVAPGMRGAATGTGGLSPHLEKVLNGREAERAGRGLEPDHPECSAENYIDLMHPLYNTWWISKAAKDTNICLNCRWSWRRTWRTVNTGLTFVRWPEAWPARGVTRQLIAHTLATTTE